MKDIDMTKKQMLNELLILRKRTTELELEKLFNDTFDFDNII